MGSVAEDPGFYRILVAVEADATRFYGPDASPPALLGASDAEQLLSHVAADLKALLPEISNCSLIAAGALYDQTQILRPAYPVFQALEAVPTSGDAADFKPGLVSIGAQDGEMPDADLQPAQGIPLGLLQLLPVIVHGPAPLVEELGQAMEYRFLEEGQVSAHSAAWMETAFGISTHHARLMTLTDLLALLRLQLEHFGFLSIWELLDAALSGRTKPLQVESGAGQQFNWEDGAVQTEFQTFDQWAAGSLGANVSSARQELAAAYGEWTREVRQHLTTLEAHDVRVRFRASGEKPFRQSFIREHSNTAPGPNHSTITEHSFSELGTIAVTAINQGRVEHYYPLRPDGLNDIHAHLRKELPGVHTVAFPGTILYDEKTRRLIPDAHDGPRH